MSGNNSWFSRQNKGPFLLGTLFAIGVLYATVNLLYKANISGRKIFHLYFLALLLGLIFEYGRVSKKWKTVLLTALGSFLLSFLAFLKGKGQTDYIFEDHLQMWPYYFLGAFVIIATIVEFTNATKKLTEGITLLLTIAINYWIFANDYWNSGNMIVKCMIVLNGLISGFTIYHALSYKLLSKESRWGLSVWSSIIILIMSIDNFLKIYQYRDIEHTASFSQAAFGFFQFFLLGVSSIYVAQNSTMIIAFFGGIEGIREINDIHLKRFSEEQVYIADSILVIIISLTGFIFNYYFQFFPINFMIWAMIVITPVMLDLTRSMLK